LHAAELADQLEPVGQRTKGLERLGDGKRLGFLAVESCDNAGIAPCSIIYRI
jgi:hypothetical protein